MFVRKPQPMMRINFDTLLAILCSIGLFYQSYQIYRQYKSGNTVVTINVSNDDDGLLPAITLCYESMFSYSKLNTVYPSLAQLMAKTVSIQSTLKHDDTLRRLSIMKNRSIDFHELFDNLTLNFHHHGKQRAIGIIIKGYSLVELDKKVLTRY